MDVMAARRQILLNEPHIATATGAVATCVTDMRGLAKECVVQINPVQSGTGDPAPDNVRPISGWTGFDVNLAGGNLFNISTSQLYCAGGGTLRKNDIGLGVISVANNTIYQTNRSSSYGWKIPVGYFRAGTKIFCVGVANRGVINLAYTTEQPGNFVAYTSVSTGNAAYVEGVMPADGWLLVGGYSNSTSDLSLENPIVRFGTYDSNDNYNYSPYTGTTYPVTFPAMGKNLFNKDATPYRSGVYINSAESGTGVINYKSNSNYNVCAVPIKPNTAYCISGLNAIDPSFAIINGNGIVTQWEHNNNIVTHTITTTTGDEYLLLSVAIGGSNKYDDTLQLEQGSSATAYEPYTNTVYGGTLDVVSGVLVVEWGMVDLGTLAWQKYGNTGYYYYCTLSDLKANSACICSCYPFSPYSTGANRQDKTVNTSYYYGPHVLNICDSAYSTSADFKAAMSGIQLAYVLATPITYQLTPQQITLLAGTNNVWADTGDTTVKYWKH